MKKNCKDWLGITGQWLGVALFALVIVRHLQISAPWQFTLPLIAGWVFAVATKLRGK